MLINERYETSALLGQGAFGQTFSARDLRAGTEVVVKLISVKGLPGWKPFEYFEREVAVLRSLDHPGAPRLLDAFETAIEGGPAQVMVMERIAGETLLERIRRGHRWSEVDARALLVSLLETLDYLHRLSPPVIHRDIKPSNVVLRSEGQPVLVDFGAVHDWGSRTGHGSLTVVGTAGYMAPEQAMGAPVPASDLYALGATLVHALGHCHPADLPRHGLRMVFGDRVGCSNELVEVLERLVEPDLRERYARASDALADLRRPPRERASRPVALDRLAATRHLVRLELPDAPRALTPVARAQLRGRSTLRAFRAMGASATAMAVTAAAFLSAAPGPLQGFLFAATMATIGGTAFFAFSWGNRRDRELHRHGRAAEGRVYDVRREVSGNRLYAHVLYDFPVGGIRYRGELDASEGVARQVQVDDPVLIIHDPGNPQRHFATLVA